MVTVTLMGKPEEVHEEARQFFQLGTHHVVINNPSVAVENKKPTKEMKAIETATPTEVSKTEPERSSPQYTTADIQAIIPKVVKANGRPAVVALLAKEPYKATKGGDVKPEHFAQFIAEAKALLPKE